MRLFLKGIARSVVFLSCLLSASFASALHVDTSIVGDKAYFLFSAPNKIAVYDMAQQSQGADITLSKIPTAFAIEGNTAYIAYHRELRALNLTTGNSEFVRNSSTDIIRIVPLDDYLYVTETDGTISVINKQGFALLQSWSTWYSSGRAQVGSSVNKAIYTRSEGISPSDINKFIIANDGQISNAIDSPYHGDYPGADRLFLNQSQSKVYDSAGIVYFAADLTYAGSLAGSVDDLTFSGDNPIVLRNTSLTLFNAGNIEQGVIDLSAKPDLIAAHGDRVFTFTLSTSGVTASSVDISGFDLPEPGEPVDPTGLAYTPEVVVSDAQDLVYLVDRESLSVFRWSRSQQKYLTSWPLLSAPTRASYSTAHQRLYLAYADGKITYISSAAETPLEVHFTSLPSTPRGLLAADNYLFATDASGAWATHYSFGANGNLLDSKDWAYIGQQYVWNPVTKRVYLHRDDTSPNDLVWRELDTSTGMLGGDGDSPYHGSTINTRYPLVVSSDGEYLLNGAGQILSAYTGTLLNALSNSINSGVWIGSQLITIGNQNSLQFWESNFSLESSFPLTDATSAMLFNLNNRLMLVKQTATGPTFADYDINNLPDADEDGRNDLQDNCVNAENADQADYDSDGLGDACDEDDDDDGLADSVELELGLNPRNATDADGDLDGDGFSNRVETLLDSDPKNADSVPNALTFYSQNFEQGWPTGFYNSTGKLPWTIQPGGVGGGYMLQSTPFSSASQSSEVSFTSLFDTGQLSLKFKFNGNNYYTYQFEVLVDGNVRYNSYGQSEWNSMNLELTPGVHTISFRVSADYLWGSEGQISFSIDNLIFDKDDDSDGYANTVDNCPALYNWWQTDSDKDGVGDECDNDPYSKDTDDDGYGDVRDNCPDIANPDQADKDTDYIGDACDPTDDRPADTDGDGRYDMWDNCPLIANPDQVDLDWDYKGDVCDDDVDGDGIKGIEEAKYSFLNDRNYNDAALDQDGDGANNLMEINSGHNPGQATNFPTIDLFDYYLLGDLNYNFKDVEGVISTTQVRKSATANEFVMTNSNGYTSSMERRADGIYIKSASYSSAPDYRYTYNNWIVVPKSLKLGETRASTASIRVERNSDSSQIEEPRFNRSIQLIETGKHNWKGKEYDSVTLEFSDSELGVNGYSYSYRVVYLKGLGSIGDGYATLESATLTNIDKPAPPANTGGGSGGGGGGSTTLLLLVMLLLLAGYSRQRQINR
ncbi:thrombospondin type 3 repeat-containing protein [Cellvibrio sp. KY-YJ-3]|uniref:thrombospondin type 3 repeat-containing protein n=1 Tax=Cellvibrio sp. KY-YJ-3 TaxID=454662 RepID=UPI00178597AB|nr:thrombospondin type 3 repeat-containing protein [Cellvibrio sp. KY-YJ-3]